MTNSEDQTSPAQGNLKSTRSRPIRKWPALVILLIGASAWIWVRFLQDVVNHQNQNIQTAQVVVFTLLALLIWCLFFSRLRWRIRLFVLGGVVGMICLTALLFRIRGVTGDLLPVLEWRWKRPIRSDLVAKQPAGTENANALQPESIAQTTNDYPQFLGPHRNCTVSGPPLARDWVATPPQVLWRQPIGTAWSGFAIAGNFAVTQEQRGEEEMVVAYELKSGKPIWSHADSAHYNTIIAGEGPRATPTIVSNRVYTLGATGILNCLDLLTGKPIWTKDIIKDNHSQVNGWGMSGSPLVFDKLVVASAGGPNDHSLVAYDKATGDFVWGGGSDGAGYSSPLLATLAGVPQVLIFNSSGIAAHEIAAGKILWEYPWPKGHPHISIPVLLPDARVLLSSGYGTGSELLQIKKEEKWSAARIWKSIRLKAKFTNVVFRDGFIYGLDDGILVCLDAATGEQKWKEGRYGHGQVILVGALLLVMAENGDVVLIEPVPQEHRELTHFSALKGKTWNPPALAGDLLLVRNDKEAACYRLPLAR
ncbi:MAG: PQQ-like beta-propeller repeat protein [Verrucomicrobia bacterium]|nr:PQQ-like beta-propeller repeat protein [Verrucomicrobiota bacterium]